MGLGVCGLGFRSFGFRVTWFRAQGLTLRNCRFTHVQARCSIRSCASVAGADALNLQPPEPLT